MGVAGWIEEIASRIADDMAQHLRAHVDAVSQPFLLDVVCDCYPVWSTPGLLLVGDAAHPMSPVGAQGINIALRDAVVAANHFVPICRDGASPTRFDTAAHAFRRERITEVRATQWLQRRIPTVLLGRGFWIDGLIAGVRTLARRGWLQRLADARLQKPNPLIDGFSEITLRV